MERIVLAAVLASLIGCGADAPAPDPIEQCNQLVSLFCVAAEECGWDVNAGPCTEYYGAMCELNQTVVSEDTMTISRQTLAQWECAPNEAWIVFPNNSGQRILDAMLSW